MTGALSGPRSSFIFAADDAFARDHHRGRDFLGGPLASSDPLGRYRYAKDLKAKGQPYPPLVDEVLPCHDAYWQTEAAMDEGAPARALEQGEKVELPPVLYLQGTEDVAHPRPHLDRFVAAYRKAGGVVDLELFEGEGQGFIMRKAGSPASNRALDMIIEFVHKQVR